MSRKKNITKREILPDPKFGSPLLAKFVNVVMERGKKAVAEKIVYNALDIIKSKTSKDSVALFSQALDNIRPIVEVKSRRVGGANYQVPVEVNQPRQMALAMRWLAGASRKRSEKTMYARLAGEILEACDKKGSAFKKREDMHRMAEANRAFAHYRW
ncbi:MAG: 30S ribosomal protein S7 [Gammaproteobacteria bacterium]|nr:30S ribosomal protein S7 [Gammaproteobacteria bacterium]